jgi:3'(2'), 5'-bisphosphate nucleotidase
MQEVQEKSLLLLAIQASVDAGKEIKTIYHSEYSIDYKKDQSPLTIADIAANRIICEQLAESQLPLISEENRTVDYNVRKHWEYFWLIDPLDGTKEFINGNGEFTVNIALIHNNKPIMGIIYAPVPDILYFASEPTGAFRLDDVQKTWVAPLLLEKIISISRPIPFEDSSNKLTVAGSRSHMNERTAKYIEQLSLTTPELTVISRGSSLKFCAIAEGSADIYPRFGPTMEWDTAAGNAIINIAGGKVLKADGSGPLIYNKPELLNPDFIATSCHHSNYPTPNFP